MLFCFELVTEEKGPEISAGSFILCVLFTSTSEDERGRAKVLIVGQNATAHSETCLVVCSIHTHPELLPTLPTSSRQPKYILLPASLKNIPFATN